MKARYLAVHRDGEELVFEQTPFRDEKTYSWEDGGIFLILPKGTIKKLIGKELTWEDEPFELR